MTPVAHNSPSLDPYCEVVHSAIILPVAVDRKNSYCVKVEVRPKGMLSIDSDDPNCDNSDVKTVYITVPT